MKLRTNFIFFSALRATLLLGVFLYGSTSSANVFNEKTHGLESHDVKKTSQTNLLQNQALNIDNQHLLVNKFNENVVVDLGVVIPKGTTYVVNWKKAASNDPNASSNCIIRESSSRSNFVKNQEVGSTNSLEVQTLVLTASCNIRYLLLTPASPIDDSIVIDCISVAKPTKHTTEDDKNIAPEQVKTIKKQQKVEVEKSTKQHKTQHEFKELLFCRPSFVATRNDIFKDFKYINDTSQLSVELFSFQNKNLTRQKLTLSERIFYQEIRPPPD